MLGLLTLVIVYYKKLVIEGLLFCMDPYLLIWRLLSQSSPMSSTLNLNCQQGCYWMLLSAYYQLLAFLIALLTRYTMKCHQFKWFVSPIALSACVLWTSVKPHYTAGFSEWKFTTNPECLLYVALVWGQYFTQQDLYFTLFNSFTHIYYLYMYWLTSKLFIFTVSNCRIMFSSTS